MMKKLTVMIIPGEADEGGFTATVEELPGVVTEGESISELFTNLGDAIEGHGQLLEELNQ